MMPSLLDWKHQGVTLEGLADPNTREDARDAAKAFDDVRRTHITRATETMQSALDEIAQDVAGSARSVSENMEPAIEAAVESTRQKYRSAWESEFETVAEDFYRRTFDVLGGKALPHAHYLKQRRPSEGQPNQPPEQGSRPPLEAALAAFIASNIGVLVGVAHLNTKEEVLSLLRKAMRKGVEEGWSSQQIAEAFIQSIAGSAFHGDSRARRIARNLVIRASNWAALEAARAHGDDWEKDWVSQRDSKVRPAHLETDFSGPIPLGDFFDVGGFQARYPLDPRLPPGQVVNCFPGSQSVSVDPSRVNAAFRSWYEGEIVRLHTSSENVITATPNHPILTTDGWVPAGKLNESHELLQSQALDRRVADFEVEDVPTDIEEVYNSLAYSGSRVRITRGVVDFYGDRPDGDVDVVYRDGFLEDRGNALSGEASGDGPLTLADLLEAPLFRERLLSGKLPFPLLATVAAGCVSSISDLSALLRRHGLHTLSVCLGGSTQLNGTGFKPTPNYGTRDPVLFRESQDRFSRPILADNLLNRQVVGLTASHAEVNPTINQTVTDGRIGAIEPISQFSNSSTTPVETTNLVSRQVESHWSGYVYTLQTRTGMYKVAGAIARNCRCILVFNSD